MSSEHNPHFTNEVFILANIEKNITSHVILFRGKLLRSMLCIAFFELLIVFKKN
jgi:hypothetical protein